MVLRLASSQVLNATILHFRYPMHDGNLLLFEATALFCQQGNTTSMHLELVDSTSLYRLALRHGMSPCYHTSALVNWQG
jgi:hypothetical protein